MLPFKYPNLLITAYKTINISKKEVRNDIEKAKGNNKQRLKKLRRIGIKKKETR